MKPIRICPICLHHKSELLYVQKFAEHFEHKIVSCLYCGFVYVNNAPDQSYYDNYYKNQSKYEGIRKHEIHDNFTYTKISKLLKKYIPKRSQILEVGCSTGKLLNYIKKLGYTKLTGVEPAPECKKIAKEIYDISVVTSTVDNFNSNKKYDLIIFSAVLEHLTDLRSAILKSYSLLKKGGMIYICVPDAGNFHKNFDEPFGEFSTEHINFFTEKSLFNLMSNCSKVFITSDNKAIISLWKVGDENENSVNKYIKLSDKKMKNINEIINLLPEKTIIWGVGALTQRLLKTTNIKNKIFKFIDNNKNLIGKKIGGIEILSPNELIKYNNAVLVSSFVFKNEILQDIKNKKLKNKIITF